MRKYLVSALAAFAVAGVSAPAMAETVTISVDYADLDLTDAEDLAELDARVRVAAHQACTRPFAKFTAYAVDSFCRADLIDAAREEIRRKTAEMAPAVVALAD